MKAVLHNAALESQSTIDAIPDDVQVVEAGAAIAAAIEPVDRLAQLILPKPCKSDAGKGCPMAGAGVDARKLLGHA